jgi:hypothetical protein
VSAMATFIGGEFARVSLAGVLRNSGSVVFRYLPMFYKRAFRFLGSAPDAEDGVQHALRFRLRALRAVQRVSAAFNLVNDNRHQRRADSIAAPAVATSRLTKSKETRPHVFGTVP